MLECKVKFLNAVNLTVLKILYSFSQSRGPLKIFSALGKAVCVSCTNTLMVLCGSIHICEQIGLPRRLRDGGSQDYLWRGCLLYMPCGSLF